MNPPSLPETSAESMAIALLADLEAELQRALNSLGGRTSKAVEDKYYFYAASHVHDAVDGFIVLRANHRLDAAKFLIRPAIETMLRIRAIRNHASLVYRILYTETLTDDRWFSEVDRRTGTSPTSPESLRESPEWLSLKAACVAQFGPADVVDKPFSAYDAAVSVGLKDYYAMHYRMYCTYTHGAVRAVTGFMDEIADPQDSRTMVMCAFAALDVLAAIGAHCPNATSLRHRVTEMSKRKPERLVRHAMDKQ
jgi:hypothetical protein